MGDTLGNDIEVKSATWSIILFSKISTIWRVTLPFGKLLSKQCVFFNENFDRRLRDISSLWYNNLREHKLRRITAPEKIVRILVGQVRTHDLMSTVEKHKTQLSTRWDRLYSHPQYASHWINLNTDNTKIFLFQFLHW